MTQEVQSPSPASAAASGSGSVSPTPGAWPVAMPNPDSSDAGSASPESADAWGNIMPPNNFVSVADLGMAILIGIISLVASRNLPGFLEMTILSRMRLMPGEGYAITTMLRYIIILVGIVVAFNRVGITWSNVHWLAAAVTVGIGFGLQEIFANFVSGLIILFERPIRLGDVVTVGDISGQVARIQIRATTIRDWDNKELILPNREFITGRFVNWSLTDTVVRLVCRIGLSYGADVRRARDLLLEAAAQNPRILKSPRPSALFRDFGDGTLNFDLRCFVGSPDTRLEIMHELNVAILESFRQAGIEIAFPQRDLHIRTLPENFNPAPR
jgi:potassium efflux system protein